MPQANSTDDGYTLPGLLLLMAAVLVVMTLAVPRLERQAVQADESNAIAALKTLNQMQGQYRELYPANGFACTLAALGGNPKAGEPNPQAAQLVPDDLARGDKAGYHYTLSACNGKAYRIAAVPRTPGKTGDHGFCTDQSGALTVDPTGGDRCTEPLQ